MNKLVPILLAACLAASCATTAPLPAEWASRLYVADTVRDRLHITSLRDFPRNDGSLQVIVTGSSASRRLLRIRYRAAWFDADGAPIETTLSSWNHTTLESDQPFEWSLTAPGRRADSYRVEIQRDDIVEELK